MTDDDLQAMIDLLCVKGVGPARARWLTADCAPADVVGALRRGSLPSGLGQPPPGVGSAMVERWCSALRSLEGSDSLQQHRRAGVEVLWPGHRNWPFAHDPDPPALVFALGNVELGSTGSWVGIVGTRRCTSVGRRVARRFSIDVVGQSRGAVGIVSGLAAGIDAEAHEGALAAQGRVIGVVACGLDVPYPRSNTALWNRVAEEGLLVSESPLGASPERWKFPARNRLIAALSDLVVVVESHGVGGALSTAEEAAARGVPVGAVPGSVLSSASEGTNALLADGCAPICSARDVLDLVDFEIPDSASSGPELAGSAERPALPTDLAPLERRIVEETLSGPIHLDHLLLTLGASRSRVLLATQGLVAAGLVEMEGARLTRAVGFHRGGVRRGSAAHRYRSSP